MGPNSNQTPGKNCRYSSTINGVENARFVKARISDASNGEGVGLNGLIIFPDVYEHPDPEDVPYPVNINNGATAFNANTYNISQWDAMEAKGAVFLPAAGCQEDNTISTINAQCFYWTSTCQNHSSNSSDYAPELAKNLRVGENDFYSDSRTNRSRGNSVRLVRDAL